jgi:hypothetical protein
LVSDIPARDGKNDNLFLQCMKDKHSGGYFGWKDMSKRQEWGFFSIILYVSALSENRLYAGTSGEKPTAGF